ncbi:MAG: LacI family DNA-binding transcriptional regulator [Lachnospiraceae bacterium]|nr:LacI family DNA-binding transcriptional regulator [Acidaminococcaceae bacterium]MBR1636098.1 LacI family DNA-binding transcriptional regulator [Lachnospiraceae bacterium]
MWDENKVRIVDIADELGVSTATVSNVLHGKTKKISDRTIKRVQDKLQERGYIPNMAATLLAQNNSRIIGVVVHDHEKYEGHLFEDPFVSGAVNALSDELERAEYFLMLKKTAHIMDAVKFASMWNMDGMILLGFCADEYQLLRDRIRIPFVVYDGFFDNKGNICNLLLDDKDGGRQVGEYLRENGHTQVLCLADNRLQPDYDRYLGLCEGLGFDAEFWEIPMQKEERICYYDARAEDFAKYTAAFAVSDYYAVDLMNYLAANGYRVPDDISVVGFDDTALGRTVSPALTTVTQDVAYRARKAVEYLTLMRDDREYSMTEIVPVKLTVRESSRAVGG